jgi:hypothetical protein
MCQSVTDRSKCICGQRSKMAFQGYTSSCKFFIFYAPIWPLFPSFKMAFQRYTKSILYIKMESLIFFPLKILKRRRTAANFSLNKDGGVFNGTMYIPFAFSYKNALRITLDLFVVGNFLYEHREDSVLFGSVTKYIYRAEYMREISFPLN